MSYEHVSSSLSSLMISVDCKQLKLIVVKHLVLLRENKHQSPQIRNQPRVNRLVAPVCCHQNLRHRRKQTLKWKLHQVFSQRIFVNIDNLIGRVRAVHLYHLVAIVHCLTVRVLNALLDVRQQQCLFPPHEPFSRRPLGLSWLLLLDLLGLSLDDLAWG